MTVSIRQHLSDFFSTAQSRGIQLEVEFESEWDSACVSANPKDGQRVQWTPTPQDPPMTFDNVSKALELELHPDFCEYFTAFFSANWQAEAQQGECELIQVWNEHDFARLQENLIGHLLMKQRLKQAPTLFFGLTDDDHILCVDNASGEVVLEWVGKGVVKTLAPSLGAFLSQLTPLRALPL